ncbi:MAG TPA: PRC-barrel domain-containing protein [Chloroflexota bacterium]|nr:PRC-barrel domain-containing protein [Chloroflexota bacterium]
MKEPEPIEERPLAWNAILENTPVYSADGVQIGEINDVLGAEDIFHGVVVRSGTFGRDIMIPAQEVGRITNRRIETNVTAEVARELPAYQPEESFRLGVVGIIRKHLGWTEDQNEQG